MMMSLMRSFFRVAMTSLAYSRMTKMGVIVAVMMIAMMKAKVQWISSKEGRSYKNCAVRCNGDHAFQFPCSDDRSTIGANVK